MIAKYYWKGKWSPYTQRESRWCGYFLLGFIPLYIKQIV